MFLRFGLLGASCNAIIFSSVQAIRYTGGYFNTGVAE